MKEETKHCIAEKFKSKVIHRSLLLGAPYNPRTLSDDSRKLLKKNLEKVGLVMPIVWNERTGNIVGGHQRLSQLDAIQGGKDYTITVAAVDVDLKTEKELNIFLNNQKAQGDWDLDKLKGMFDEGDISVIGTGFDNNDIMQLFGELPAQEEDEFIKELADKMEGIKERFDKTTNDHEKKDQVDFYSVLIFDSNEQRDEFNDLLNLPQNRYIKGDILLQLLKNFNGQLPNSNIPSK